MGVAEDLDREIWDAEDPHEYDFASHPQSYMGDLGESQAGREDA